MSRERSTPTSERASRFTGCLLGGAVGDALGGPVEFLSLKQIRQKFGPQGVTGFEQILKKGDLAAITDDTQMTLFTAEGLLRAYCRGWHKGICDPVAVVHHAYIRWLHTQGMHSRNEFFDQNDDGWLICLPELHHRRAPGNTCLSALQSGKMGTPQEPINTSKGCGGVMRAAPVGLFSFGRDPLEFGAETAAITHGHPSGYLSAGCLAQMIHDLVDGRPFDAALDHVFSILADQPDGKECLQALQKAVHLWKTERSQGATAETVEKLGAGWVGEEALAIGVYCALAAQGDFARGVQLAVNHSGDSDSTGSIAGNLLGAMLGKEAIPARWLARMDLREVIETVAEDLLQGFQDTPEWWEKYPGW